MLRIGAVLLSIAFLASACGADPERELATETSAMPAQPRSPQLFAPQIVSTELPEFATAFSPDSRAMYFNRTSADRSKMSIYSSTLQEGAWTPPAPLPFSDSLYHDIDPFVSADGQRIYFNSTRPLEGTEPKDYDIWYVERGEEGWSDPINAGAPINTDEDEVFVTAAQNGNLYFSIFADSTRALYRAERQADGTYRAPEPLQIDIEVGVSLGNPAIAPDESYLIVTSREMDSLGGADLFLVRRNPDGTWGRPENLGPEINSPYADFAPHISLNGDYLYFTSERPGIVPEGTVNGRPPGDIYEVRWSLP